MTTPQRIRTLLASLYGEERADSLLGRIERLIQQLPLVERATMPDGLGLSERDAMLITYGDQLIEPEQLPLATLADFCETHLKGLLSMVHVLPFYPWSSDDGFSVIDYFGVDPKLGSWNEIQQLGHSFPLMMDAVINHVSRESLWFQQFLKGDPEFEDYFIRVPGNPDLSAVVRPRALPLLTPFKTHRGEERIWTTFSADQVDLNFRNLEVLLHVLEALLFYVRQGARCIRLDAIAYLWKEIGTSCIHLPQTHKVIQLMRLLVDWAAPGVLLITETNVPHRDNVSYFGDGINEAHLVYNFALPPLTLHALLSENARHLTEWADSLRLPSGKTTWFNFLASHDGIGLNPARGILEESEILNLAAQIKAHGGLVSNKHNSDGDRESL